MIKNIGISGTPEEIQIIGDLLKLEGYVLGHKNNNSISLITYSKSKRFGIYNTELKDLVLGNNRIFKVSEFDQAYQYLFDTKLFSTKYFKKYHNKLAIQCNTQEEYNIIVDLYRMSIKQYWDEYKGNTCLHISDNTYSRLRYFQKENYTIIPASFVLQSKNQKTKEMNKVKKIIGYLTPYDINAVIHKDSLYVPAGKSHDGYYCRDGFQGRGSEWYLPKQIVEQWTPVYEEEREIVLNIGNPRQKVIINSDGINCDGRTMSFSDLQILTERINDCCGNLTWRMDVTEVELGCSKFSIEEFSEVVEASKKFNS
jgi:hypothetical protein